MKAVLLGHPRPRVVFSGSAMPSPQMKMSLRGRRCPLVVRASDDEDIVPIISGTRKRGFTPKELDQLRHPNLHGGKSIGQELAIIREKYLEAEAAAEAKVSEKLFSDQWDGDVWVGSRWNTLTIITLISMLSTAGVGLFAWLSYGHLWGITPGLYSNL